MHEGGPRRLHRSAGTGEDAPGAEPSCDDLQAGAVEDALTGAGAYGAMVYLRSRDRRSLMLSTVAGLPVGALEPFRRVAVQGALPGPLAYRSGRTVHLAGAEDSLRRFPQLLVGLPYAFASAYVPVTGADETYGVLCALWPATPDGVPAAARRHLRRTARRLGGDLDRLVARGEAVEGRRTVAELPWPPAPTLRVGLFDLDLRTRALEVDDTVRAILGLPPGAHGEAESLARVLAATIDPDDLPRLRNALGRAAHTSLFPPLRLRFKDGAGRVRTVQIWGQVRDGVSGDATGPHLTGAVLDAGTAAAAAQAVERLRRGVFSLDPDGRVDYVNLGSELLLASRREELLGRRLWEALPWLADPAVEDRHLAAVISRQPTAFLARRPPDSWLAFSLYPDAHGMTGTVVAGDHPAAARHTRGRSPGHQAAGAHAGRPHPADAPAVAPAGARYADALAAEPAGAPGPGAGAGAIYHLLRLASAMSEAVSVREVCAVVAEQILPAFGGQEVAIYLAEESRLRLALQVGYPEGFLDPFEGTPVQARLPGAEALATGVPIFFASVDELAGSYPGIALDQMCAWAFLPLMASGRPVGSCILGFDEPHTFTSEERAVLTALCGLIAQALERARLYDAEFALARGLQQALLPHALPRLKGVGIAARYLPGTRGMEIGGDWYDTIVTPRGLCLVVGDVEGHSVAAAGVMGQLRSAVRAFVASGHPPGEVLALLNRLLPDLDSQLLASCCLVELDPSSGRASGVRAGHLPPVLRHPDGHTEVLELGGGVLLGVDPEACYPVEELTLAPGSVLALYTDGLVERPGTSIDRGIDGLRAVLERSDTPSLESLADRLLAETLPPGNRADDVAVLLARLDG
ncbi:SpoIIE family protein phosphatase [Streptacidiphilus jiangxiensis]|uniref:protein-serine/threonine phosphatase n=1 Tax=Streptacidiphilus jiangxiensis TaxID=235985 RepID=A0A1H7N0G0_STRJI|nr:SpoIIE family protein phosphatase [Streptacidiphilus jiangxiensis]SEL16445.1 Serine phosphatase RsbU, regulator of sigma subunit [Streptacidiphilus jiangxiensis]